MIITLLFWFYVTIGTMAAAVYHCELTLWETIGYGVAMFYGGGIVLVGWIRLKNQGE